jgi:teichuronic acid biosynthesis glycosyltransferase TuaH
MKSKKILYLLHTDWYWIKQRTQFLAESIADQGCDVDVIYKYSPKKNGKTKNAHKSENLRIVGIPFLPFKTKLIPSLKWIDEFFWKTIISVRVFFSRYDCIVVTHPLLGGYVKNTRSPIIYDLHDDNAEFYPEGKLKELIVSENQKLLLKSDQTIFSSNFLLQKFPSGKNGSVIRNAHGLEKKSYITRLSAPRATSNIKRIYYFGTISEWFDFGLLRQSLDLFEEIEFHLIGPADCVVPVHPRIVSYGAMEHSAMIQQSKQADAFIMPFVITPLIEGVDPVKIYEYLSFPVPILVPAYDEISHFGDMLNYYETADEFNALIKRLFSPQDVDISKRIEFLSKNSWQSRSHQLQDAIERHV